MIEYIKNFELIYKVVQLNDKKLNDVIKKVKW
jgi:hypothetical protein